MLQPILFVPAGNSGNLIVTLWPFIPRSYQAITSYSSIGGADYISAGVTITLTSFGPESDLSMKGSGKGSGPELALEYERRSHSLPVSVKGRITAFQMNLTAKLEEPSIGTETFAGGSSSSLSWASFENSYRNQGYALSLRGDYRLSGGTQLFLELYALRSDSTLKSTDIRFMLAADQFGIYMGEPPEVTVSLILLSAFEKKKGNAEVIQTVTEPVIVSSSAELRKGSAIGYMRVLDRAFDFYQSGMRTGFFRGGLRPGYRFLRA